MNNQRLCFGFLFFVVVICAVGNVWGREESGNGVQVKPAPGIRLLRIEYEPKLDVATKRPRWEGMGSALAYVWLEDRVDFAWLKAEMAKENSAVVAAVFNRPTIPVMLKQVSGWKEVDMKWEGFAVTALRDVKDEASVGLKINYHGVKLDMELWDGEGALMAARDRASGSGVALYLIELQPTPGLEERNEETVDLLAGTLPALPVAR